MLYLAEVIKQTRAFMGAMKTELKLLACQHNDQTWSAIPTEEIIFTEQVEQSLGEGTLMTMHLGLNKQLQETPQLAGTELVRQLQRLSRLSEKLKTQQDEIEQWKQSLTYQNQEISRRELELQARFEQLEEMEQEFQQIERRSRDVEEAEGRLIKQQQKLEELKNRYGLSVELPPDRMQRLKTIINRFSSSVDPNDVPWNYAQLAQEAVQHQKNILLGYWEQLKQHQREVDERKQLVDSQRQNIERQEQELLATQASLEEIKVQLEVQQTIVNNKQELLHQISLNQQITEEFRDGIDQALNGTVGGESDSKIDVSSLEQMPLGELEGIVNHFKEELDKLVRFVNDQEEELSFQIQTVNELQDKMSRANDYERITLEQELAEEQEAKKMLDQTLVGQRRTLKDRQKVFMTHLRILRRRQGIIDLDESDHHYQVRLQPVLQQLDMTLQEKEMEKQNLEAEIEQLRNSLNQIKDLFNQQQHDYHRKAQDLEHQKQSWQQLYHDSIELETRCQFYQVILQPIQDETDKLTRLLQGLSQWFIPTQE